MRHLVSVVTVACVMAVTGSPAFAADLPMGHPDFYPSAQRPVGWRGDGTGAWPGATPVKTWDVTAGQNVAWMTAMPGPSFSQPIVVGDKVFALADPALMVCLSAKDGEIIWQTAQLGCHHVRHLCLTCQRRAVCLCHWQ